MPKGKDTRIYRNFSILCGYCESSFNCLGDVCNHPKAVGHDNLWVVCGCCYETFLNSAKLAAHLNIKGHTSGNLTFLQLMSPCQTSSFALLQ